MAKTQSGDFSSKALAKNVVFSVVTFALNFFISFYITPRIAGQFGSDTYGYLKLANDFASYAALFSIALNSMASRFIMLERARGNTEKARQYFSSVGVANTILALIFVIPWSRAPEEFHKIYLANTDAFYRLGGNQGLAKELDEFVTKCALSLWSRCGRLSEKHVAMANQIYSRNQPRPTWLLWGLTSAVCEEDVFMPPVFYWNLAESDAKRGTDSSRTFIRMLTNILLYLAAVDDDVSYAEAEFITECTDRLTAICDTSGVRKSRDGLNPPSTM